MSVIFWEALVCVSLYIVFAIFWGCTGLGVSLYVVSTHYGRYRFMHDPVYWVYIHCVYIIFLEVQVCVCSCMLCLYHILGGTGLCVCVPVCCVDVIFWEVEVCVCPCMLFLGDVPTS